MGKLTANGVDRGKKQFEGARNTVGVGDWFTLSGPANLSLWGSFVGEVILERTFDAGTTVLPCTALGETVVFRGPASEVLDPPEAGVLYRINFRVRTSGTLNWRVSL